MENRLLKELGKAVEGTGLIKPLDARTLLATNPAGRKYKKRMADLLEGLVWHQELGWGSIEGVAKYHTGKNSHLIKGGVESISYTLAIRKNGQIVLCNDLDKKTWSQGDKHRPGDENAQFLSVMFEGMFNGPGVTDPSAGEPNADQITAGMLLWNCCKKVWGWNDNDLYGHYHFGKPACPGRSLQAVIEATRSNAKKAPYKLGTTKGRQQALIDLGHLKGKADGKWGPASKAALVSFQNKASLSADGVWGPNTEKAVKKALAKKR